MAAKPRPQPTQGATPTKTVPGGKPNIESGAPRSDTGRMPPLAPEPIRKNPNQDYVDYLNAENAYYNAVTGQAPEKGGLPTSLTASQVSVARNGAPDAQGDYGYIDASGNGGVTLDYATGSTRGYERYDPNADYGALAAGFRQKTQGLPPTSPDTSTYYRDAANQGLGGRGASSTPGGVLQGPLGAVDPSKLQGLSGPQRNAFTALQGLFDSYGLGSLAPQILGFIQQGYDQTTTGYLLQQTPEYQQRFAGNQLRVKSGLAPLSPAEYLATERSYKDAAQAYGLPSGFYDNPSDFANLIGKDISPTEFQQRASYAFQFAQNTNPQARQALQDYYGVDSGHIAAYFLDPNKAQAVLDKQVAAANIGSAALKQGVQTNRALGEQYADMGVSQQQAFRGFGQVNQAIQEGQLNIAQRFGSDLNTTDISNDLVAGLASAQRKRNLLNQQETGLFSGSAGTSSGSFGTDNLGSY